MFGFALHLRCIFAVLLESLDQAAVASFQQLHVLPWAAAVLLAGDGKRQQSFASDLHVSTDEVVPMHVGREVQQRVDTLDQSCCEGNVVNSSSVIQMHLSSPGCIPLPGSDIQVLTYSPGCTSLHAPCNEDSVVKPSGDMQVSVSRPGGANPRDTWDTMDQSCCEDNVDICTDDLQVLESSPNWITRAICPGMTHTTPLARSVSSTSWIETALQAQAVVEVLAPFERLVGLFGRAKRRRLLRFFLLWRASRWCFGCA